MPHAPSKEPSDIVIRIGRPQMRVLSLLLLLAVLYSGQQQVRNGFRDFFDGYAQTQQAHHR